MKSVCKILLVPLALALQVVLAHSESAIRTVGGTNFNLPAPKGFCIADQNNPADGKFISIVGGLLQASQNRLIMTTVECGRLQTLRAGGTGKILNYALYYLPYVAENASIPGETQALRQAICAGMRKQGNATLDGLKDIVAQKAKEMGTNIEVSSTSYIGVVDQDQHGCYAALLVGFKDGAGNNTLMSSIVTSTVLHARPLFFAFYSEYTGPETTLAGVQAAKATAAELDEKNP